MDTLPGINLDRSTQRIQALEAMLRQPGSRQAEIGACVDLAWELRMHDPQRAVALGQQACALSAAGEFADKAYAPGMAGGLVCQAFVETYAGDLGMAVAKCHQALALLNADDASLNRLRAYYTLSWNHFFLGEYPSALDDGLRALNLARQLESRLEEAWALDVLGACHGSLNDWAHSLPEFEEALRIFRELGEGPGQVRVLNNLGYALYSKRESLPALEMAEQALRLSRQLGMLLDFYNGCCTVAQILIDIGRLDEAEAHLQNAVAGLREENWGITHVNVFQEWSRLCMLRDDLSQAEIHLERAIGLAQRLGRRAEQAACHRSLSVVYERQGNPDRALLQYKLFHEMHESVMGEQSARRLAVLQITHELEASQREADLYRLRTAQLEQEIDEHKRIQDVLERESMLDPLTDLANRRVLEAFLNQEIGRHARLGLELSVIMIDLDQYKAYNDSYGHIRGDACLQRVATVLRAVIARHGDLVARFGGDEFICILPETDSRGAQIVAERVRAAIADLKIPHRTSSAAEHVTASLGVITTVPAPHQIARDLIELADAQLYLAKAEGRDRYHAAGIRPEGEAAA